MAGEQIEDDVVRARRAVYEASAKHFDAAMDAFEKAARIDEYERTLLMLAEGGAFVCHREQVEEHKDG